MGYDPFVVWQGQWRGYLEIEIRAAQTDAREHERMMQAARQREADLKAQLKALPTG